MLSFSSYLSYNFVRTRHNQEGKVRSFISSQFESLKIMFSGNPANDFDFLYPPP